MWLAILLAQTIVPLEAISAPAQSLKFYLRTMPSLLKKLPTRHSSHPLLERHARLLRVLCASEHTQTCFFHHSPRCSALDAFYRMHRYDVIVIVPRNFYTHSPCPARSPLERNSRCARLVTGEIFLDGNTDSHDIQYLLDGYAIISGCSNCMTRETKQSSL